MTNQSNSTQDTEDVVILSSRCGHHFDDDCESCQSAKDSNDYRLQSLSDRIDGLAGALREIAEGVGVGAASDWTDAECSDYWSAKALGYRRNARAALHQEATAP